MMAIDAEPGTYAGLTAFYAIVHLTPKELPAAFRELLRVLRPGGPLLLSFHLGAERVHVAELLQQQVDLDFTFFARAVVERALEEAGFTVAATLERAPYTAVEHPTRPRQLGAYGRGTRGPGREHTGAGAPSSCTGRARAATSEDS